MSFGSFENYVTTNYSINNFSVSTSHFSAPNVIYNEMTRLVVLSLG